MDKHPDCPCHHCKRDGYQCCLEHDYTPCSDPDAGLCCDFAAEDSNQRYIGQLIRETRKRKGISRRLMAEAVGCSETTISCIEQGKRKVKPKYIPAITEMLGLTEDRLK